MCAPKTAPLRLQGFCSMSLINENHCSHDNYRSGWVVVAGWWSFSFCGHATDADANMRRLQTCDRCQHEKTTKLRSLGNSLPPQLRGARIQSRLDINLALPPPELRPLLSLALLKADSFLPCNFPLLACPFIVAASFLHDQPFSFLDGKEVGHDRHNHRSNSRRYVVALPTSCEHLELSVDEAHIEPPSRASAVQTMGLQLAVCQTIHSPKKCRDSFPLK